MADDLRVVITGSLNSAKTIENINAAIASLASKINAMKITVDIPKQIFQKIIESHTASIEKLKNMYKEYIKQAEAVKTIGQNLEEMTKAAAEQSAVIAQLAENLANYAGTQLDDTTNSFFIDGIQYVNELYKALSEISVITGKTVQEVNQLGAEYQKLGETLRVSSLELTQNAAVLFKQGLSEAEVRTRLETVTKFSKIASADFKQSADSIDATASLMNVSAEKASDTLVFLSGATKTAAEDLAAGFQKMGSSASAIKLPFEFAASMLGALTDKTHENTGLLAEALNKMFTRFQMLEQTGTTQDGQSVFDINKALQSANVNLLDQQGGLREYKEILTDLGQSWGTLSGSQQAYIAIALGGADQQLRFQQVMQTMPETIRAYDGSLKAAGETNQKYALYTDSTHAHMERFKNAMEGMWQQAFDSESIRIMIDAFTGLMRVLDGLATVTPTFLITLAAIGTAGALLVTDLKTLTVAVLTLGRGLTALGVEADAAKLALRGLAISTVFGAALAIVGLVVEKIVEAFSSAKDAQEQYANKLNESIATTEQNISALEKLNKQYRDSSNTQEQLIKIREQMAGMMPEIIDHFDSEGKAVYKNSQQIEELIKQEKELNRQRKEVAANTVAEGLSNSAQSIDASEKKIAKLEPELNYNKTRLEALKFAEKYMNDNKLGTSAAQNSPDYSEKMMDLNAQVKAIFKANKIDIGETFLASELIDSGVTNAVEKARLQLGKLSGTIKEEKENINSNLSKFFSGFQTINDNFIEQSGSTDKNLKAFLDKFSNAFLQSSDINGKNYQEVIGNYRNLSEQIGKAMLEKKIDLGKMIETRDFSQLQQVFQDNGISVGLLNTVLQDYKSNINSSALETEKAQEKFRNLNTAISGTEKSMGSLKSAYQTLQNGEQLSIETTVKLADEFPEIRKYLLEHNGLIEDKGAKLQEVANIERSNRLKEAKDLLDSVTDTYNSLENKRNLYKQFYEKINPKSLNPLLFSPSFTSKFGKLDSKASLSPEEEKQSQALKKEMEDLQLRIKLLSEPIDLSSKSKSGTSSSAADALKEALEYQDVTKEQIDQYNEEYEIRSKNLGLAKEEIDVLDKKKDYNKALSKTVELLQKQLETQNILSKAREDIEAAMQTAKSKSNLSDLDTDSWFYDNGEASLAYKDYLNSFAERSQAVHDNKALSIKDRNEEIESIKQEQKAIEALFGVLSQYQKALNDNSQKSKALQTAMDSSGETISKYNMQQVDDKFSVSKNWIDNERSSGTLSLVEQIEAWRRVVANHNEQSEFTQNMIISIKTAYADNPEEAERQIQAIRDANVKKQKEALGEIDKLHKEVIEGGAQREKDQLEKRKQAAKDIVDAYKKSLETQRDAELKGYETSIKAEEKRHQKAIQNLDDEMSRFEQNVNDQLRLLDRQNETADYQDSLKTKQDESQKIQSQINVLKLDDSIEAAARRKELEEQLNANLLEIEKMKENRSRTVQKEALQDTLDNKKREVDASKKSEDQIYDTTTNSLNSLKEIRQQYWDNVLNNDLHYTQMQEDIVNGHYGTLLEDLNKFKNELPNITTALGNTIADGYISQLQRAIDMTKMLTNGQIPNTTATSIDSPGSLERKNADFKTYLQNKLKWQWIYDATGETNSAEQLKLSSANNDFRKTWSFPDLSYEEALNYYETGVHFATGGMTPSFGSRPKLAWLDEKELVLNQSDTFNLLKVVDFTRNLISKITVPSFSQLLPRAAAAGDVSYNLTLHIDSVVGDKTGGQTVFNEIVKGLQKMGK
ncbi:phage tail tape measure protein [Paenibacillus thalictri]|uniref:Phage tail tape measure protein n=1 Tax=Paenibacillus thalictri TaxID=2527873 RepID=A0A4Q9DQ96_9BACL|nr:phage tail tape measure protein [Paenibacillus thalictri]TBL76246.1 phage tail tape measure protein [Paenibacillus thalictri]